MPWNKISARETERANSHFRTRFSSRIRACRSQTRPRGPCSSSTTSGPERSPETTRASRKICSERAPQNRSKSSSNVRIILQIKLRNGARARFRFYFTDSPRCQRSGSVLHYAELGEPLELSCAVEAFPSADLTFSWKFVPFTTEETAGIADERSPLPEGQRKVGSLPGRTMKAKMVSRFVNLSFSLSPHSSPFGRRGERETTWAEKSSTFSHSLWSICLPSGGIN